MIDPAVEVPADEIKDLLLQLEANAPDGLLRLTSEDGRLVAEWVSAGTECKFGPAGLPPSARTPNN
jgi:hypothetical protein